jgi:hypothetical protein
MNQAKAGAKSASEACANDCFTLTGQAGVASGFGAATFAPTPIGEKDAHFSSEVMKPESLGGKTVNTFDGQKDLGNVPSYTKPSLPSFSEKMSQNPRNY